MTYRKATITDVARLADVSISTVSRVLNNTMPVSETLVKKVLKAVKELDYQPNIMAQNLRQGSTDMIGVVIPNAASRLFIEIYKGVSKICLEHGRLIYFCDSDEDPEKEHIYTKQLIRMGVDGIIFLGAFGWKQTDHIEEACNKGVPVVIVNREIKMCTVDIINIDRTKGNYLATSHLIEIGHTKIGCIAILSHGGIEHEQLRGYRQAIEEAGLIYRDDLVVESNPSIAGGFEAAKLLIQREDPPTAIFCQSDNLAIGTISAANELGMKLPEDISIVGFSDYPISKYVIPPLTTIRQPMFDMGIKAATLLFERMNNKDLPQCQVIIEPTLVIRKSTATIQS